MTKTVTETLSDAQPCAKDGWIRRRLIVSMMMWDARYPDAGCGVGSPDHRDAGTPDTTEADSVQCDLN